MDGELDISRKGMLYNISGSSGVEIRFKDTLDVIRIGTKNSAKLKLEIVKRIKLIT